MLGIFIHLEMKVQKRLQHYSIFNNLLLYNARPDSCFLNPLSEQQLLGYPKPIYGNNIALFQNACALITYYISLTPCLKPIA